MFKSYQLFDSGGRFSNWCDNTVSTLTYTTIGSKLQAAFFVLYNIHFKSNHLYKFKADFSFFSLSYQYLQLCTQSSLTKIQVCFANNLNWLQLYLVICSSLNKFVFTVIINWFFCNHNHPILLQPNICF